MSGKVKGLLAEDVNDKPVTDYGAALRGLLSDLEAFFGRGANVALEDLNAAVYGYRVPEGAELTDAGYVMPETLAQGRYDSAATPEHPLMRMLGLMPVTSGHTKGTLAAVRAMAQSGAEGKMAQRAGDEASRYKAHDLSREMNWKLREGLPLPEEMQAVAASLDAGMSQHGYGTLWRGVGSGPYARAQVGEVVTDPGYMSFSTSRDQANTFGSGPWGEPALVALRRADKVPAYQFADGDLERELVVGRNTPMRVVDRLERDGQRPIVWVEAVR